MEATASYLERPPKRKRESSYSRSGPADESRGAKSMEPPNPDSTRAARLVALYRRLWDSYVAKNAESQRLDKENQQLKNANASFSEEKQQAELCSLEYDKIEEGIIGVLENWKAPLVDSVDAGKQKQDGSD
ncbi:uncharacterized protein BJX67DRAFT_371013 [Aspergillus lucknowensis]|uniref:Uncharacterized protein n=1 Tax=Aspergillus lucknowensis TaxID=176173 RepID=A0ABR4LWV8_9EURO